MYEPILLMTTSPEGMGTSKTYVCTSAPLWNTSTLAIAPASNPRKAKTSLHPRDPTNLI